MESYTLFRNTGIKQNVIQEIIELAQKYSVKKVILFGSRARGDYKERSDIDLDKPVREELLVSIKREGIVIYDKI